MTINPSPQTDALTALLDEVATDLEAIAVADPRGSIEENINAMLARVAGRVRLLTAGDLGYPASRSAALAALANVLSDDALHETDARYAVWGVVNLVRRMSRPASAA